MDYASPWDLLIQGIKLHQTLDLVGLLLERLDCALDVEEVSAPDWLLPVRLSTQRLQGRGVNQCWEPARRLAARRQLRCSAAMLLRVRDMSHQLALPAEQRAANVRQAFLIEPRQTHHLRGRHVAVLDDVMTTGATIHELALTLRRAGALSVQAWALAHTPIHDTDAMFNIVLVHPEIPPNTGNVIRLAANTGCSLHLIEPLGFSMEDRLLQRAGLDYHEYAPLQRHADWQSFVDKERPDTSRMFAFTTRGSRPFGQVQWQAGDWLVFGSETAGLPAALRDSFPLEQRVRLPMRPDQRSLNLSNAVAVTVFEAWRQNGYAGSV